MIVIDADAVIRPALDAFLVGTSILAQGNNDTELALELIKMDFKNNPKKFRANLGLDGAKVDTTETKENNAPSSNDNPF